MADGSEVTSILVLGGESSREDVEKSDIKPDYIVKDLSEIIRWSRYRFAIVKFYKYFNIYGIIVSEYTDLEREEYMLNQRQIKLFFHWWK